jgi:hypothetical protein
MIHQHALVRDADIVLVEDRTLDLAVAAQADIQEQRSILLDGHGFACGLPVLLAVLERRKADACRAE